MADPDLPQFVKNRNVKDQRENELIANSDLLLGNAICNSEMGIPKMSKSFEFTRKNKLLLI